MSCVDVFSKICENLFMLVEKYILSKRNQKTYDTVIENDFARFVNSTVELALPLGKNKMSNKLDNIRNKAKELIVNSVENLANQDVTLLGYLKELGCKTVTSSMSEKKAKEIKEQGLSIIGEVGRLARKEIIARHGKKKQAELEEGSLGRKQYNLVNKHLERAKKSLSYKITKIDDTLEIEKIVKALGKYIDSLTVDSILTEDDEIRTVVAVGELFGHTEDLVKLYDVKVTKKKNKLVA